jgi:hypothetical protein
MGPNHWRVGCSRASSEVTHNAKCYERANCPDISKDVVKMLAGYKSFHTYITIHKF